MKPIFKGVLAGILAVVFGSVWIALEEPPTWMRFPALLFFYDFFLRGMNK